MAESNHRSYSAPVPARGGPTPPRDQPDDPLARLALLIGQSVPMKDLARGARHSTPAESRSALEFNPPAQHGYAAVDDVFQEMSEGQYSTRDQSSYDLDSPNHTGDNRRYELLPLADASRQSRSASYEHELPSHSNAADLHLEALDTAYDEHGDQEHDHPDDHAYEEDPNPRRRSGFISVAAVFGLALLGTAGAFAYRSPFADLVVPSPPSIIKAEGSPNKIIPASRDSQGTVFPQSYADNGISNERLGARKEPPLDVPPPLTTAPQPDAASVLSPMAQPAARRTPTVSIVRPPHLLLQFRAPIKRPLPTR